MTLRKLALRNALKLIDSPNNILTSSLREDIRNEMKKEHASSLGGGDFHSPFWRDAKDHVVEKYDLSNRTQERIDDNPYRKRLYPMLEEGFLEWWRDFRLLSNEKFKEIEVGVYGRYKIPSLDAEIKVENLLALKVGDHVKVIYPYFSEKPILSKRTARLGRFIMKKALPNYDIKDMIILDVLRGEGYDQNNTPLKENEEALFTARYSSILAQWVDLADEYYNWSA